MKRANVSRGLWMVLTAFGITPLCALGAGCLGAPETAEEEQLASDEGALGSPICLSGCGTRGCFNQANFIVVDHGDGTQSTEGRRLEPSRGLV